MSWPLIAYWATVVLFNGYMLRSIIRSHRQCKRLDRATKLLKRMRPLIDGMPQKDFNEIMHLLSNTPSDFALLIAEEKIEKMEHAL